ncbi:MAG: hypothetical protein GY731_07660, partial [Gammaproteobacteria bacterium]|nr:hypothetical protein [Gammaproteobacteria bacterium]
MLSLNNRHTIYLTLLVLGAYAQIAQALLVRESLVVFYGNEVSLGVFFASWLFWIGVGSAGVNLLRKQRWFLNPVPLLRILILSLPLLLTLQTLAMRSVRALLEVSSTEFVPLGDLLLSVFIINLPASLALGMAFPLACRRLSQLTGQSAGHPPPPGSAGVTPALSGQDGRIPGTGELKGERLPVNGLQATVGEVSRLYIFEALGALLGGVLFTFVLIEWLGVWRTVGTVATLLAVTGLSLSEGRAGLKLTAASIAVAGLLLAATPLGSVVHRHMESWRFTTLQPGLELLDSVETRYGHVALARHDRQISVVADGRISESFPDRQQAEQEAAYLYTQSNGARRVLMLGGIAGGLAEELLRYPVERLEIIVEDRSAFENLRPHLLKKTRKALADPRVTIHFEDGRRIVRRLSPVDKYDLVLVLTADPSSAHNNRYFTLEFYRTIRSSMSDKGVLCTGVSSASNYLGRDVSSYSGSVFRTLSVIFPHLAIAPGDRHLYCASPTPGQVSEEPRTLVQR